MPQHTTPLNGYFPHRAEERLREAQSLTHTYTHAHAHTHTLDLGLGSPGVNGQCFDSLLSLSLEMGALCLPLRVVVEIKSNNICGVSAAVTRIFYTVRTWIWQFDWERGTRGLILMLLCSASSFHSDCTLQISNNVF